jgi:DUF971 family protein
MRADGQIRVRCKVQDQAVLRASERMVTLAAPGRLGRMNAKPMPVTIDVERDRSVTLTWADGMTSGFGLEELRQRCPCAECRTRRDRALPVWPLASSPQPLRIVDAKLVGAWGIGFTWNDGHSTGIYSWELLRPDGPA